MRNVMIVVGLIALVLGGIFAGQGANLIPGSSMTAIRSLVRAEHSGKKQDGQPPHVFLL